MDLWNESLCVFRYLPDVPNAVMNLVVEGLRLFV